MVKKLTYEELEMKIKELEQSEEQLVRMKESLESLWNITRITEEDIKTICDNVLVEILKITQSEYAFYCFLDDEEKIMILPLSIETMSDCHVELKTFHLPISQAGIWAEAVRKKSIVTVNDYNTDQPGKKGLPKGHVPLLNMMAIPVIKNNKVVSIATVANKKADYSYDDGKQTQIFLGNIQILIDRKRTDDALQKSDDKYRTLFENMTQGVFYQRNDGKIVDFNQNALEMFGLNKDQFLGRTSFDPGWKVIRENGSDFPGDQHPSMVALQTGKPVLDVTAGVFNTHKQDFVWLKMNAIPQFKNGESKPYQVFVTLHDITELRKTEENLRQAHKMRSISTLTKGVAHDFNNLLFMIVGNTEMALEDIPKWNPVHESLEEIKHASLKAASIVKQLLNFSRKADQELKPIGPVTIIKNIVRFLRSTIPSTTKIKMVLPDEDVSILGDPAQINQLMMNLCTNASQAMEEAGGTIEIKVENLILDEESANKYTNLSAGKHIKISVCDSGPGIASDLLDRIFDPYFTTKKFGASSGMGLTVVHGIVKNHNGIITVKSKLGEGTKFNILFPVNNEEKAR